ncbi:MAG: allophanate hydrolase [Polyangia bacterium]
MLAELMSQHSAQAEGFRPNLRSLECGYGSGQFSPAELMSAIYDRASQEDFSAVWIHRVSKDNLVRSAKAVEKRRVDGAPLPLFGIPFAVKDNIDVAGVPTTAACPAFAYTPKRSAVAVERLIDAGAIFLGKTNLDQFATGLVGTRSPFGIPPNPFDRRYIPGGSSSGSAVAVATGMAAFALGTDTAGSGRVPAAFNNIVGLKPSRGLISTTGVVPACRSLDCLSIFALCCEDAWRVFEIARHFDSQDPFSRHWDAIALSAGHSLAGPGFRFGVPDTEHLSFLDDEMAHRAFAEAVAGLQALGGQPIAIDFAPFCDAAHLLYEGPWVAQRLVAAGKLFREDPEALDPNVKAILAGAQGFSAEDAFRAQEDLSLIRRCTQSVWSEVDVLVTPTVPTVYTVTQVQADPIRLNANLGLYTNFVNLLDLCALAVPAGFRSDRLPFGITLMAPRGRDASLVALGVRFLELASSTVGLFARPERSSERLSFEVDSTGISLGVLGAHLSGEPLNYQLVDAGATFVRSTRTASRYHLFELQGMTPTRPGLVCSATGQGTAIELEIWRLPPDRFGLFISRIPPPLCVGSIELEDGQRVQGFLCEHYALLQAKDISSFGGWRPYRRFLATTS